MKERGGWSWRTKKDHTNGCTVSPPCTKEDPGRKGESPNKPSVEEKYGLAPYKREKKKEEKKPSY